MHTSFQPGVRLQNRSYLFTSILTVLLLLNNGARPAFGQARHSDPGLPNDSITVVVNVQVGWNMLSRPVITSHDSIVPYCCSGLFCYIFCYQNPGGWGDCDTRHGAGWFLKCPSAGPRSIRGWALTADTVSVTAGWNLVGSISYPVPVEAVTVIPAGNRITPFWAFANHQYVTADTIVPGYGYWVKMQQTGSLILASQEPH